MHVLIVGGTPIERAGALRRSIPDTHTPLIVDAGTMPFVRARDLDWPPPPRVFVIEEIERAFPDSQSGGTRLVLTQSPYLLQKWIDRLDERDLIVATADRAALEKCAPEFMQARGCWSAFEIRDLGLEARDSQRTSSSVSPTPPGPGPSARVLTEGDAARSSSPQSPASSHLAIMLARAFSSSDPAERMAVCREAVALAPESAVAHLALASAYREARDGTAARDALDRAAGLAPEWEAVAYESGKLWLVYDDMAQARDAFERAADLMPTFSAACSNLGATLGELGEPDRALEAFRQALAHDPRSFTTLNNIGVVCRELGRLGESEAALRQVIRIKPAFVFGHYNLGHTLFLAGRHRESLDAYEEGQRRDPQKNRRQGCRLAVMRFANGDPIGAERDLWTFANAAPADEREELLLEAYEVANALLAQNPGLEPHRPFLNRIGAEIAKSE